MEQAVALRVYVDRVVFLNCRMEGYQDTLWAQGGKQFYRICYITGFVIHNCSILVDRTLVPEKRKFKIYLGRPLKEYSTIIVMESNIGDFVSPEGWLEWDGTIGLKTLYYAEFNNRGRVRAHLVESPIRSRNPAWLRSTARPNKSSGSVFRSIRYIWADQTDPVVSTEEVGDGVQAQEVRDYEEIEVDSLVVEIVPEEEMIARASKKSKTAQPQISAPIEFFPSRLKEENLPALKREYGRYLPSDFEIIIPSPEERVNTPPPNCRAFYTSHFEHGLRFPLSPILRQLLETFFVFLTQLVPNAIAFIMAFSVLMVARGLQPSFRIFPHFFRLSISTSSNRGYYYVSQRPGFAVLENAISSNSMEWKSNFFFVKAPTLRILENGETEEFTYDWGYNQSWVYGGRKVTGEMAPDDHFSSDLIEEMRSDKYQSAYLVGEIFLRKTGLSSLDFPIPSDDRSLTSMVENCRFSVVGKTVLSNSKKSSGKVPIEQRQSRKRRRDQHQDLEDIEEDSFENADPIRVAPPPTVQSSTEIPSTSSRPGRGFPPKYLREEFGILGCKTWPERNPTGPDAIRKTQFYDKEGEYFTHVGDKCHKASLVDMIESHLQGKRAAGYSERDSLTTDDTENVIDKAIRLLLSSTFVKDVQRTFKKNPLDQLARAAHAHEVVIYYNSVCSFDKSQLLYFISYLDNMFLPHTGNALVSAMYDTALHREQCKFVEESNNILTARIKELEDQLAQVDNSRTTADTQPAPSANPNLETDNPHIISTMMDASRYQVQVDRLNQEIDEQRVAYATSISKLESEILSLRSQLAAKEDDSNLDKAIDEHQSLDVESVVREFLDSSVHTAIIHQKIGGLLLSSFYKGVDQLIESGQIPDKRNEYREVMEIGKDRKLREYPPDSLPSVEYNDHPLANLVAEFGTPLPVPAPDLELAGDVEGDRADEGEDGDNDGSSPKEASSPP
ncbi:hypothetical protein RD792_005791 [Penstemon davidsonii]|uniref:Pectinesterase n=1 Tax=Penstemon davidsonii TaxID=160366 RepID=A0ABR0DET9_9LAMI|nr:hypothetical protein RD792_005791 [Penstemon davidsonii]